MKSYKAGVEACNFIFSGP